jgi:hypothetical protein
VYVQNIPIIVWIKRGRNVFYPTKKLFGKINVWAAISCFGKISIHIFDGVLTAKRYVEILDNKLIQ